MLGFSKHGKIAAAAMAGLMLASSAAFAQNHFERNSLGEVYDARAQEIENFGYTTNNMPGDFVSSHVCINGWRYITRNIDSYATPAQNSIPVRC